MHINGCASSICFREHLTDYLHPVRLGEDDHDDSALLTNLHTEIARECKDIHQMHDYDLSQFRRSKTIERSSPTFLQCLFQFSIKRGDYQKIINNCIGYPIIYNQII